MFKSILPVAKRTGGTEGKDSNTHPILPDEGKENNHPGSSLPQLSQKSPTKASLPHSYDGKRNHLLKFSDPKAVEAMTTDHDFEKLLVRCILPVHAQSMSPI